MTGGEQMHDLIFTFTYETYSDAVSRGMNRPPDRLLQTVLDHPRIGKVLVANPYRSGPIRAVRTVLRRGDHPFPATDDHRLFTPLRLARQEPKDVPNLREVYRRYERAVHGAAEALGARRPAVITANPLTAAFCDFEWGSATTFYARDDWSQLPARRPWWNAIRAAYRDMSARGIAVVAVSEQILERIQPTGPSAVVPNGVEPAEWRSELPAPPELLAGIPHPRALYVGTLDSRLDVEGVAALARRRPDLHIVLLGARGPDLDEAPLRDLPNVHLRRSVGRAELVAAIRNSDLCLVAHRRTALTKAMSPLKIYEYLAGGRPVLSIDLPPVRGISDRVLLTDTVEQFGDRLDEALALGVADEAARLRFVEENSWRSRHEQILEIGLRQ